MKFSKDMCDKKLTLTIFATLFCLLSIHSQPRYHVKTFNMKDGLASNIVTDMEQTKDGLMWFSTWSGLASYDGYRFQNYFDAPDKSHKTSSRILTTNRLLNITLNCQENLWCITHDLNPYLFDREQREYVDIMHIIKERFGTTFPCNEAISTRNGHTWLLNIGIGAIARIDDRNFRNPKGIRLFKPNEGILKGKVFNRIYEDEDGGEWIITNKGVIQLDGGFNSDLPFQHIQQVGKNIYLATDKGEMYQYDKQTQTLEQTVVFKGIGRLGALKKADDNHLIAATDKGIYIYNIQTQAAHLTPLPDEARIIDHFNNLYPDNRNRLWMLYGNGNDILQIHLHPDSTCRKLSIKEIMPPLQQSYKTFFHQDREGTIWAATETGFFGFYDEKNGRMVSHPLRNNETEAIIDRWHIDKQRNLWYSNNHNLAVVLFKPELITLHTDASEARSMLYDSRQRLWTGFRSGVLTCNTPQGIRYLGKDGQLHTGKTTFSTYIYSLFEDSRKNLWIGTKGDGIYRLSPQGGISHYKNDPKDSKTLCSDQVYSIFEDHAGRIWIGTFEKGICLFHEEPGQEPVFIHTDNLLGGYPIEAYNKVRRITETKDSVIVVSCSNGLVAFSAVFNHPEEIRFRAHKHIPGDNGSLLTSDVMQTLVTQEGTLYLATVGGGLQRIRPDKRNNGRTGNDLLQKNLNLENVSHIVSRCGTIFGLAEDNNNHLWIGCENNLIMYNEKEEKTWCFGPSHIGEGTRLAEALPAYNPATDEMTLGTSSGSLHFQCKRLQEDDFIPAIAFSGIQLHHTEEENFMPILKDTLHIAPEQRNLTIHFAAIDYQDNQIIRYAYRIDFEKNRWNNLGNTRTISFNKLPHGYHRLQVRSTNAYGTWVDNTRTLHLFVQPTFWESWKGKGIQALMLIAVIILAVWLYYLRTRTEMQRKLDRMKLEFFTDISHKLRTPLTLIGGPITEALKEEGLSETVQSHLEMVQRNASRMLEMVNKMLTYTKGKHNYISDENVGLATGDERRATSDERRATGDKENDAHATENGKPHLLVVEDNDDLRDFLSCILESEYEVTQAVNGREGLEKARAMHPDFILTDVMMPEMDGLSMVREIKGHANTSHIPIVILSAKASMDDRIEGLKLGVNDYITKPFSATYLKQRMANIISNRHTLQQAYLEQIKGNAEAGHIQTPPNDTQDRMEEEAPVIRLAATNIVDSDKLMMEKLIAYIDEHLDEPELKIEDLASALCLGRTVFYNKVRTLVGMSPVELLRQIRIQRAEDMVAGSNEPFSRIAYAVGFNDPRYFSKSFKAQTGLTPSEYRERSRMKRN